MVYFKKLYSVVKTLTICDVTVRSIQSNSSLQSASSGMLWWCWENPGIRNLGHIRIKPRVAFMSTCIGLQLYKCASLHKNYIKDECYYLGITLHSALCKLFTRIINNRLTEWSCTINFPLKNKLIFILTWEIYEIPYIFVLHVDR